MFLFHFNSNLFPDFELRQRKRDVVTDRLRVSNDDFAAGF